MHEVRPATEVIAALRLEPHREGGYFRETYRAPDLVDTPQGQRARATSIAFLVTLDQPSRFHRLRSAELWVHRAGAPLELWLLEPGGGARSLRLGAGGRQGGEEERRAARVPPHVWQGARVVAPADRPGPAAVTAPVAADAPCDWSLVSCIVTPGFEYADFELGHRGVLLAGWPQAAGAVQALGG